MLVLALKVFATIITALLVITAFNDLYYTSEYWFVISFITYELIVIVAIWS